jgi:hypothetical protein
VSVLARRFLAGRVLGYECKITSKSDALIEMGRPLSLERKVNMSETLTETTPTVDEAVALLRRLPLRQRWEVVVRLWPQLERVLPPPDPGPLSSLRGLWRGLDITDEDIEEVRREMWGRFPAEDV